jgi:ADP-heptose:LPS heptosyltransferase
VTRERVLVLRTDNIGDMVLFSGAFRHLRALYPEATISLAARGVVQNLVERCPYIDEIVPWETLVPNWSWLAWRLRRYPRTRFALREVRGAVYARCLDRRWGQVIMPIRSPTEELLWFVRHSRIPHSTGIAGCSVNLYGSRYRPEAICSRIMDLEPEKLGQHELETTRQFLSFLRGGKEFGVEEVSPVFWTDEENHRFAEAALPEGGEPEGITVALVPGAASRTREWKLENYLELFDSLPSVGRIVILGGRADVEKADRLKGLLRGRGPGRSVVALAGKTTLRQMVEVIRRCRLLIGVETGALHIATALGVPSVGILGGGHFGRFYPWGNPAVHRVAASRMDCYGCQWRCVHGDFRCIPAISTGQVSEQAQIALKHS